MNDQLQNMSIPEPWLDQKLRSEIGHLIKELDVHYIVLDDDPTGSQTIYDVPVLTSWEYDEIYNELELGTPLFFILTNSRSLTPKSAALLAQKLGRNINKASTDANRKVNIICRGDSTLRGHFPLEEKHLNATLGQKVDLNLLIPAFFEGGRYTINDIQYLQEGNSLMPVGNSQFARDKVFGYNSSNLRDWIVEKSFEEIGYERIYSIKKEELAGNDPTKLILKLSSYSSSDYVIVNVTNYRELDFFTFALMKSGLKFSVRSSASFVSSISGHIPKPLLERNQLTNQPGKGGVIVVGSYVPKSTEQLAYLLQKNIMPSIRIDVTRIVGDQDGEYLDQMISMMKSYLNQDLDVVIYTSRDLKYGASRSESLQINRQVSKFIVDMLGSLELPPRFILAKGGITSSDVATKSLGVKKAHVMGQLINGVPIWTTGLDAKFKNLLYIIFPGNVGSEHALYDAYKKIGKLDPIKVDV